MTQTPGALDPLPLHPGDYPHVYPTPFDLGDDFAVCLEWVSPMVGGTGGYSYDFTLPASPRNLRLLADPDLSPRDWSTPRWPCVLLGGPIELRGQMRCTGYDGARLTMAFAQDGGFWFRADAKPADGLPLRYPPRWNQLGGLAELLALQRTEPKDVASGSPTGHIYATGVVGEVDRGIILRSNKPYRGIEARIQLRIDALYLVSELVNAVDGYRCSAELAERDARMGDSLERVFAVPAAPWCACTVFHSEDDPIDTPWYNPTMHEISCQMRGTGQSVGALLRDLTLALGVRLHVDEATRRVSIVSLRHRGGQPVRIGRLLYAQRPEIPVPMPLAGRGPALPRPPRRDTPAREWMLAPYLFPRAFRLRHQSAQGETQELLLRTLIAPPGAEPHGEAIMPLHPIEYETFIAHAARTPEESVRDPMQHNRFRRRRVGETPITEGLSLERDWIGFQRDAREWATSPYSEYELLGQSWRVKPNLTPGALRFEWEYIGWHAHAARYRGLNLAPQPHALARGHVHFPTPTRWLCLHTERLYQHMYHRTRAEVHLGGDPPGRDGQLPPQREPGQLLPDRGYQRHYFDGYLLDPPHNEKGPALYMGTVVMQAGAIACRAPRLGKYYAGLAAGEGAPRPGALCLRRFDRRDRLVRSSIYTDGQKRTHGENPHTRVAPPLHRAYWAGWRQGDTFEGVTDIQNQPHPHCFATPRSPNFRDHYQTDICCHIGRPHEAVAPDAPYPPHLDAWVRGWACALQGAIDGYRETDILREMETNPQERLAVGGQMLVRASLTITRRAMRVDRAEVILWEDPRARRFQTEIYTVGEGAG